MVYKKYIKRKEKVFDLVNETDNKWLKVKDGEYLRVKFERNLTSRNDISFYARSSKGGEVEVYTKNSDIMITKFYDISDEKVYKVYLDNLKESNDVFDLKIIGEIEFDHIIDPVDINLTFDAITPANGTTTSNTSVIINITIENADEFPITNL